MKKRRFPLSLAVLLPTLLAVITSLGGLYLGGYFVLRDTAFETAVKDDVQDLGNLNEFYSQQDYASVGYGLMPVVEAYRNNKPQAPLTPGSAEEAAYKKLIQDAASSYLNSRIVDTMQRYVTTFVGIFYEDVDSNRMVLICMSSAFAPAPEQATSLYLGAFFDRGYPFTEGDFYGYSLTDSTMGKMVSSGLFMAEVKHPTIKTMAPARLWLVRETLDSEVYATIPRFTQGFAIVASVVLILLSGIVFLLLYFLVIRKTKRLANQSNAYVQDLEAGQPGTQFTPINKGFENELSDLNNALYYTQEAIRDYSEKVRKSAAYEERINADLALAERIQGSMVPSKPMEGERYLVRGYMKPAKEVGGDLYNYFMIDESHVAFFIGDVSGKGVPAALFMAKADTVLRMVASDLDIHEANRILCDNNSECLFVTAFVAVLDISIGVLRYVNAGHEPVFVYHEGSYSALEEESNFPLGCDDTFPYAIQERKLDLGDRLFLYTDGVSEAMNVKGELFGRERILNALNDARDLPSGETMNLMMERIGTFVGEAEQSDDACMVALDYAKEYSLSFEPTPEGLEKVAPFVDSFLEGKDAALVANVQVILDELCSNVVFYSQTKTPIRLVLRDEATRILGAIVDEGIPFDPLTDKPEHDESKPGGLGIVMVQAMSDGLHYSRIGKHNILHFQKIIDAKMKEK